MAKQKNLKQKAASGIIWTSVHKFSRMGIQFISGIILARLLTPYDYGCIGMLSIFLLLADTFIDGGFGSALIQKKRPTQEDYSTIFWWNLFMSLLMYSILYLCAPAIARFYNIPLLSSVLRVQGLVVLIYAMNVVQRNQLKKRLNFKVLAIIAVLTSVISLIVTIVMAYKGFGVWALVTQNLLTAAIPSAVFWGYIRWRPSLVFSWKSFRELFSFGIFMFFTLIVERFSTQITGLIIGKVYNPSTLGYYSKALGTEKLASHSISQVMSQVTYPLYAEVQDDKESLINIIKRLTTTISYITFPLMFVLMLIAKPLFILLYSERWIQSIPYFQVLCFAGLAACLQSVNLQTISAIGKSKVMFKWTVVKRIIGIVAMIGGLLIWGMYGLLFGVILNAWFSYFVNISLVSKHIGYKWTRQLLDISPIAISSIIFALICYGCGYVLKLPLFLDGVVKLLLYLSLYIGWSVVFKPESYLFFLSTIPEKFKIVKKKKI